MLEFGVLRSLLLVMEHVASWPLWPSERLLGERGGGVTLVYHGNCAFSSDRHVRWCLLIVLAEGLARQLHTRLVDNHSTKWVLGWSTESTVHRIAGLAGLRNKSGINFGVASLLL